MTNGLSAGSGEDRPGDALQQAALETGAGALEDELAQPPRVARGKFHGQHSAERDAQQCGFLQAVPIEELGEVVDELGQTEPLAQSEAIVLAAELIADHSEITRQQTCQRTE